ncbi:PREDICTED: uncharacterized protein LOC109230111 [Nicotiana attenuata]|uniref:uncharacterized protein LOC109230111 n=1 Tax=Nicotiana attenuata TaxID=49451 RepID=UPI000904AA5E|nr:PREDICTED: uncharacterized protein LOC109230111 [Nicotiana attenuata]
MRQWRALRQFTLSTGKSAGRNSSGRITVFHRGGGSKRLQRRIDLKRSTSSVGIVERIEYEPNRSSRIAPERGQAPPALFGYFGETNAAGKKDRSSIGAGWVSPPYGSGLEIERDGTRQSQPYLRLVPTIRNSEILYGTRNRRPPFWPF